ncbi:MAG: CAP domain-containing protein [Pelagimonas sp.]|jgi:hypothetical protein|nr:CAP domain-containing protein [Pelagimonas sp.]
MNRRAFFALSSAALVAACADSTPAAPKLGPDGKPLPKLYRIGNSGRVQFRLLDSVNALRQAGGVAELRMDSKLNAAAATHARDMAVQNRPWHFGSDGSSPIDRVQRVGYTGRLVGETLSETYETELQTLAAWMEEPATRQIIMDASARDLGFNWHQESNGKIWWVMVLGGVAPGAGAIAQPVASAQPAAAPAAPVASAPIATDDLASVLAEIQG